MKSNFNTGGKSMPIHDWTRVRSGTFHFFHQHWIIALCDALNSGVLPPDYFAMAEQIAGGPIPDVLALEQFPSNGTGHCESSSAVAVASVPPKTRFVREAEEELYARKADRIAVRHHDGRIVAVIEIVSPGNKDSRNSLRSFVDKAVEMIRQGIHLLVIDLFPPSKRDPHGIHKAIWDEIRDEDFDLPPDKSLMLAAYSSGTIKRAYVEPVAVGDALPDMPLFLDPGNYVPCPLEATYQTSWRVFPSVLKRQLETAPNA
jgi:hypothetical protein